MASIIARHPLKRLYHMADKVNANGDVSPLCAKAPRAIDLKRALWTVRKDAVTCPRCLRALRARESSNG